MTALRSQEQDLIGNLHIHIKAKDMIETGMTEVGNEQDEMSAVVEDPKQQQTPGPWSGLDESTKPRYLFKVWVLQTFLCCLIIVLLWGLETVMESLVDKSLSEEKAEKAKKWKLSSFTNSQIADAISSALPHTGLQVHGYTLIPQLLPSTTKECEELLGLELARRSWPNQRDLALQACSQTASKGYPDLNTALNIPWVRSFLIRYATGKALDECNGTSKMHLFGGDESAARPKAAAITRVQLSELEESLKDGAI